MAGWPCPATRVVAARNDGHNRRPDKLHLLRQIPKLLGLEHLLYSGTQADGAAGSLPACTRGGPRAAGSPVVRSAKVSIRDGGSVILTLGDYRALIRRPDSHAILFWLTALGHSCQPSDGGCRRRRPALYDRDLRFGGAVCDLGRRAALGRWVWER
jgi:hypothetical protein